MLQPYKDYQPRICSDFIGPQAAAMMSPACSWQHEADHSKSSISTSMELLCDSACEHLSGPAGLTLRRDGVLDHDVPGGAQHRGQARNDVVQQRQQQLPRSSPARPPPPRDAAACPPSPPPPLRPADKQHVCHVGLPHCAEGEAAGISKAGLLMQFATDPSGKMPQLSPIYTSTQRRSAPCRATACRGTELALQRTAREAERHDGGMELRHHALKRPRRQRAAALHWAAPAQQSRPSPLRTRTSTSAPFYRSASIRAQEWFHLHYPLVCTMHSEGLP